MHSSALKKFINVTEYAAIAAYELKGQNQEIAADLLAVSAMRSKFISRYLEGEIVIGEGERDQAPMLYIGEKLGKGGAKYDIAVDPLEGTTILAQGKAGALSVMAIAEREGLLHAPDINMAKIANGFDIDDKVISLNNTIANNIEIIANAKACAPSDLSVTVLDRARHEKLISDIKQTGAKVKLIQDGDIAAVIATTTGETDIYMGIGGAPEGVLAAAALKACGGFFCGRLLFEDNAQKQRGRHMGITDFDREYFLTDLVKKDAIFIASGVTDGPLLQGVSKNPDGFTVESLIMDSATKNIEKTQNKLVI